MQKININDLKTMIRQEIDVLREQVDHAAIKDVVTAAQKLLSAIEAFKSSAPPAAINAVTPNLDQIAQSLENMVTTPGSYVQAPRRKAQRVSLKAAKAAKPLP